MSPRETAQGADGRGGTLTPLGRRPIVSLRVSRSGPRCPFSNDSVSIELRPGGCVLLAGNSGAGKSTIAARLAGLSSDAALSRLGIRVEQCAWDPSLPLSERCGVLFQQTTLIDALTVAGNVAVALESSGEAPSSQDELDRTIKRLVESVGLDYARDARKRPTELSGGMARRASLALQLAQKKHVIVLDEPFAGLDREAAADVARELVRIRKERDAALLLISHEPEIAALVMDEGRTRDNVTVVLEPPTLDSTGGRTGMMAKAKKPSLYGKNLIDRFVEKLMDYFLWSLPLISLTFVACGLAISMLSSDLLRRVDVTEPVLGIVNKEIKPLLKLVTGQEEANPITMMMINMKVRGMLNDTVPGTKAKLYALGMAKLFVLEIGPLVTALLLSGRIGGSYAGEVSTMQATAQNKLLRTLGINPRMWTLLPALAAGLLASPTLTVLGTALALFLGGIVGPKYGIGSYGGYMEEIWSATFPSLRLRSFAAWEEKGGWRAGTSLMEFFATLDLRSLFSESYWDALIETVTYPPIFHLVKASTFILIIILVSETVARWKIDLTPRGVPHVITSSVVVGSLVVIVADWGFSQLLLKRR